MRRFTLVLVAGCGLCLNAGALDYDFEDGTQGWTAVDVNHGVDGFGAPDGKLEFDYVAATPPASFDPQIISPVISVAAAYDHWLAIEVNITADPGAGAQTFQLFFSNEQGGFSEGRSRRFSVTPNAGWQTIIVDLLPQGSRDPWEGTINRVRLDPGGFEAELAGYQCAFERITLSLDTDNDGIADDLEYYWFFQVHAIPDFLNVADAHSDSDSNGILDSIEMALGWDPMVDEGEQLPAGNTAALLALVLAILGVAGFALRRSQRTQSATNQEQS